MNLVRRQRPFSEARGGSCRPRLADSSAVAECVLEHQVRQLVHAACAARLGAAQMTLDDWRDVEQELKQKLNNKKQNTKKTEPVARGFELI